MHIGGAMETIVMKSSNAKHALHDVIVEVLFQGKKTLSCRALLT